MVRSTRQSRGRSQGGLTFLSAALPPANPPPSPPALPSARRVPLRFALPLVLPLALAGCGGRVLVTATASVRDAGASEPDSPEVPAADAGTGSSPSTNPGAGGDTGVTDAGAPVQVGDGGPPAPVRAPGYLHTSGPSIVDDHGQPVAITGLNWFGLETPNYAPHGLWARPLGALLDQIKSLGYNTIRLPFSSQLLDSGSTPNRIDFNQNPDLVGKTGLQIMDAVVAGARARGLRIFLDRHRPDSAAQSALWYTAQYPEQRWISDWQMLAQRYEGDPTVIGADLHNEPHGAATWGDGNPATDWAAAAERAGNAILAINPHLLIIVEGIERYNADGYWWGGNLEGVARRPLALAVPNQLVYSAHEYPASVYAQAWFSAPNYPANLDAVWHDHFGFIADAGMAPVLVGEFGTFYQSSIDQQWLQHFTGYVASHKLSFTYWCLNPDSGDTGGILQDDWKTVITAKQDLLKPLLAPAF